MNAVLTRSFTRREQVMIIVLVLTILVGLYFYAVHYPIVNRMDEIAQEHEELALKTEVAEARYAIYQSMKAELEKIFAMPKDELTVMPEYDNFQTLMNYFNVIFQGTDPSLNFDAVRVDGKIAARTVRFSFTAEGYAQAKRILGQLTGTGYRCLMENVSLVPVDNEEEVETGALKVSGSITFYELAA